MKLKYELYSLKCEPIYSSRIWGGNKLKTILNKKYNQKSIGESWEISDIEDNETLVCQGDLNGRTLKSLIDKFKSDFVGKMFMKPLCHGIFIFQYN